MQTDKKVKIAAFTSSVPHPYRFSRYLFYRITDTDPDLSLVFLKILKRSRLLLKFLFNIYRRYICRYMNQFSKLLRRHNTLEIILYLRIIN